MDSVQPHEFFRALTVGRPDLDNSVLSVTANPFIVNIKYSTTLSTLGVLDVIPPELLNAIMRRTDMRTVSTLRTLNRRMRMTVDTLSPYKAIARHAPEVVTALARTGVASHFTLGEVYYALCTPACHVCGKFGTFLWIPGCIRCCFTCLKEAPELMPMTRQDAKDAFGLTDSSLANVPIMTTLPGKYSQYEKPYKRERFLLSQEKARQVAVVVRGGEEELEKYIKSGKSKARAKYEERIEKGYTMWGDCDSQGRPNRTIGDITRFLSAILLPYFNTNTQTTPASSSCKGCEVPLWRESDRIILSQEMHALNARRDQLFTEEGFLEHFKECPEVRELWRKHLEEEEKRKPVRARRR